MALRVLRVAALDRTANRVHYAQSVVSESMWEHHGPQLERFYAESLIHDVAEIAPVGCEWRGSSEWAVDINDE